MRLPLHTAVVLALLAGAASGRAQDTRDLGLPPPSGSQNPVLPPPSGSQNPVLPPQSGQRYMPGIGGQFGERQQGLPMPPRISGSGEIGVTGIVWPEVKPGDGGELDRLADLAPAIRRCWTPPLLEGPNAGAMATVRFSLRRDGSLFGQPRVAWGTKRSDPTLQARFSQSVIDAVRSCTPLRLSPRLGASIAGRPFSIRFHGRAPSTERST